MVLGTETKVSDCPFCNHIKACDKGSCGDCPIRNEYNRKEDHEIAENLRDYWKHLNSGAERNW